MISGWSPRFFSLGKGDIRSSLTGTPFWNALLQTQEYAGEEFPIRNFVQPAGMLAWNVDTTNKQVEPVFLQVKTDGAGDFPLLTRANNLPTPSAPTSATVGVASAAAVSAKTNRQYLCLVNTSANWIYLGFGSNAAVVGSGVALAPNGGSYEMTSGSGNLHDLAINAIASAAASNLAIQEA